MQFTGDSHQLVLNPPGEGDTRETNAAGGSKATRKKAMPFSFDRAYDENTEQHELFDYVGLDVLKHAWEGFNTVSPLRPCCCPVADARAAPQCVFA